MRADASRCISATVRKETHTQLSVYLSVRLSGIKKPARGVKIVSREVWPHTRNLISITASNLPFHDAPPKDCDVIARMEEGRLYRRPPLVANLSCAARL